MSATCHYVFFAAFTNHFCIGFVAYPKLLESRDDRGQLVLQVHNGLTLNLEKSSVLAKNLQFIYPSPDSHTYTLDGEELEKNLYHDTMHTSSLIVDRTPEGVQVRGILGRRFTIAPLGLSSRSGNGDIEHQIDEIMGSENAPTIPEEGEAASHDITEELQCDPKDFCNRTLNPKQHDEFVVEMCIVTTSSYADSFSIKKDLLEYVATLVNGVQLRYADMDDPKISFQLSQLLVAKDEHILGTKTCDGSSSLEENDENMPACGFDAEATLNKTTEYVSKCSATNCDVVYLLISADLTHTVNGTVFRNVQGMTEIGGVCSPDKVAVGEDTPKAFTGLITMTHELGHLLGSDHDGCPGAENCSPQNGNLMSQVDGNMLNKSILSDCTKRQIRFLFKRLPDSCIYVNTTAKYRNKVYPVENITEEDICKLIYPDKNASVSKELPNMPPCEVVCCWGEKLSSASQESSDGLAPESQEAPESITEEGNDDPTDYYADGSEIPACEGHHMPDGMRCGPTETCYKGICGNHSWDEIWRKYGTNRTFHELLTY